MDINRVISEYERLREQAAEKSKSKEKKQVNIKPDCFVAKKIDHQTALLYEIRNKLSDIEQLIKNEEHSSPLSRK